MFLKLHKTLAALATLALALSAKAQKDTVYTVPDVEVVASREKTFNAGTSTWQPDSAMLAQYKPNTLADILSQQSGSMFLRTFTPGALATPVARGTYAVHTAVVWNGFNILSPMNQLSDLNLIPAFFIDGLALGMGSQNALYGSGAVGSTISFNQARQEKDGLHGSVLGGMGSFGTYQQGAKLSYKKGLYTGKIRYFNQIAQNNYEYINTAAFGKPLQRLENARTWLNGQMLENYFQLKKNQSASLNIWYTQAYRGVPPKMIQDTSVAFQKDNVLRITGDYKIRSSKIEAIIKAAYFDERIRYNDLFTINANTQKPIDADNRAYTFIMEADMRYRINTFHLVSGGINNSYFKSTAEDYGKPAPVQQRSAAFASYRYFNPAWKFQANINVRQEIVTEKNTEEMPLIGVKAPGKYKLLPFIPSVGFDWTFYKGFTLFGKASRLYRYPHFNDLYWSPGGNPGLKPENGLGADLGLAWKQPVKRFLLEASATAFYNNITNWILWMQGPNNIWSPENIQQVKSRGGEAKIDIIYKAGKSTVLKADARYSYTISTNEKKRFAQDESYKKQLLYVPYHTGAANISFSYKRQYIRLNGQYTGKQFTTADNTGELPGFYTLNVFAGKTFAIKNISADLCLQARNITNRQYMVVEWLPMPGRNYLATLLINF